jgi:integral membrane protein
VTGVSGLSFRALRVVALLESLSFLVLLVGSVLKRTTDTDLVPVLGPVHGALFVALVVLVLDNLRRLRWAPWFTLVMLTVGSPAPTSPSRPPSRPRSAPSPTTPRSTTQGPVTQGPVMQGQAAQARW